MTAIKQKISDAFGGAHRYEDFATIQRRVAEDIAGRMLALGLGERPRILEIGCGTGFVAQAVQDHFTQANWLMTDISPSMVERSRRRFGNDRRFRFAVLDGEHPVQVEGDAFDLVCASLVVQWFQDLEGGLVRLFRLLRPGGHLLFSTLVEGTFAEWDKAFEQTGIGSGIPAFPNEATLRGIRLESVAGDIEIERLTELYGTAADFLRMLRAIGARTPRPGYRPLAAPEMRRVMRRFDEGGATSSYCIAICRFTRPGGARA